MCGMEDKNYLYLQNQNNKISNSSQPEKIEKNDLKGNGKLLQIFNYFDTDGSGVLEAKNQNGQNELLSIWNAIQISASQNGNQIFEDEEALNILNNTKDSTGKSLSANGIEPKDLFEFLAAIFKSKNIEETSAVEQAGGKTAEVSTTNSQRKKPTQEELDAFKKTITEMKNPDGTPRFKEQLHIDALMELSVKVDFDLINKFVTHKDRTGNYTFNIDDIVSVGIALMDRENIAELSSSLSQIIETRPELLKLTKEDRTGIQFRYLMNALESDKDLVFKYMKMRPTNDFLFGAVDYKYSSLKEILTLAESSKIDEEMVAKQLARGFTPENIGIVVAFSRQNEFLIDMLVKFYALSAEQVAEIKENDWELVSRLIDAKNSDGAFRFDQYQILRLVNLARINKPLAERLISGDLTLRNDEIEQASKANNNYEIPTLSYWSLEYVDNINEELNEDPKLKEEIFSKIPTGEVGEINGKLYCNAGDRLVEIKLKRETFERLFPRDQILNIQQGNIGDCWLISTIGNYMRNPETRHYIYQMFEEAFGGDIVIRFPDSETVVPFLGGEPYKENFYKPPLVGIRTAPDGIRMLEQAFAVRASKCDAAVGEYYGGISSYRCYRIKDNIDSMMTTLKGNAIPRALRPIAGKNADIDGYLLTDNGYKPGSIMHTVDMVRTAFQGYSRHDYTLDKDKVLNEITTRLEDKNTLIMVSTKDIGEYELTMDDNVMLSLCGPHAYYVVDVDKENGLIYIVNPWDNAEVKAMPIDLFMNELCTVSFAKLK